jgi:hypothetical protein
MHLSGAATFGAPPGGAFPVAWMEGRTTVRPALLPCVSMQRRGAVPSGVLQRCR